MRSADDLATSPYSRLGLRGNPFIASDTPGVVAKLWIDRGCSAAPQPQARQLVQVIGVIGAGKTSHLRHWQAQTGGPYCYYPPGWRRLKIPTVSQITYWDEADRIPFIFLVIALAWAKLTGATVVAGTHADLGNIARQLGLRVTTIRLPPLDAETLMAWATCQIEAVRLLHMNCRLTLAKDRAEAIVTLAKGSWREAANHLHVWAAGECVSY